LVAREQDQFQDVSAGPIEFDRDEAAVNSISSFIFPYFLRVKSSRIAAFYSPMLWSTKNDNTK
jgi:hypothetical protein